MVPPNSSFLVQAYALKIDFSLLFWQVEWLRAQRLVTLANDALLLEGLQHLLQELQWQVMDGGRSNRVPDFDTPTTVHNHRHIESEKDPRNDA